MLCYDLCLVYHVQGLLCLMFYIQSLSCLGFVCLGSVKVLLVFHGRHICNVQDLLFLVFICLVFVICRVCYVWRLLCLGFVLFISSIMFIMATIQTNIKPLCIKAEYLQTNVFKFIRKRMKTVTTQNTLNCTPCIRSY